MPDNKDPYTAPEAHLEHGTGVDNTPVLATRIRRFAGALIDSLIVIIVFVPIMFLVGIIDLYQQDHPQFLLELTVSATGFVVWLMLNGYLLYHHAQTIGKRLVGTRIVDLHNRPAPMSRIVLYRTLPIHVLSLIPFLGSFVGLIDVLFIFGSERRCLHDHIAGTRVIMA